MNTEKKSFLTPCRSVGLKRRSVGSTPPTSLVKIQSPQDTDDSTNNNVEEPTKRTLPSPLTRRQPLSKRLRSSITRRVQLMNNDETTSPAIEKEISSTSASVFGIVETVDERNLVDQPGTIAALSDLLVDDDTSNIKLRISNAEERISKKLLELKDLQTDCVNSKQHDLQTLNNLISKWRTSCQQAITELLNEYTNSGKPCTMSALIQSLGIPSKLIHYSDTEMDFYE